VSFETERWRVRETAHDRVSVGATNDARRGFSLVVTLNTGENATKFLLSQAARQVLAESARDHLA
jgi:hypothetical protein